MSLSVMPTCATPASTMLVDSGAKMRCIVRLLYESDGEGHQEQ